MTDLSRPDADEPSILSQLGFTQPAPPVPGANSLPPHARPQQPSPQAQAGAPVAATRREARAVERQAAPVKRGAAPKPAKTPKAPKSPRASRPPQRARSAEGRIRQVQKSYASSPRPARRTSLARTVASKMLSIGAMIFAGALAVGMSVPANAFGTAPALTAEGAPAATSTMSAKMGDGQTLDVASTVETGGAARDAYTVTSWAEMLRLQYGTRDYNYTMGDPNGPIRWPFPYPVPISSGFGERNAPCYGCSSMHMGLDFTPGEGAPIYAMADGVVSLHDEDQGGFGNWVTIDHGNLLGDGSNIKSVYAHMQWGSSTLKVGDTIEVGDFIGLVGRTGTATGNHLHFEVHVNDVQVDPFAWLKANT